MFYAWVLICAGTLNGDVLDNCVYVEDTWGPYKTLENCEIRSRQLAEEVLSDPILNFTMRDYLSFPPAVYYKTECLKDETISS
jgi:hypothetical protein